MQTNADFFIVTDTFLIRIILYPLFFVFSIPDIIKISRVFVYFFRNIFTFFLDIVTQYAYNNIR